MSLAAEDVRWDLTDLVRDRSFDELLDAADTLSDELARERGQVADFDTERLLSYMQRTAELHDLLGRGGSWASLQFAADMVDQAPGIWTFRGQVLPESQLVSLTLSVEAIEKTPARWTARAQGSVWVDGRRIYHVRGLTVSFDNSTPRPSGRIVRLDPAAQPWWTDHRPTYAAPVLPGMAMVSIAMDAAPDAVGLDDLVLRRWLVLDQPRTLTVERGQDESSSGWIGAGNRTVKRVSPNVCSSVRAFAST